MTPKGPTEADCGACPGVLTVTLSDETLQGLLEGWLTAAVFDADETNGLRERFGLDRVTIARAGPEEGVALEAG